MRVKFRIVSVLLAVWMLVSLLSACDGRQSEESETKGAESIGTVAESVSETSVETEAMPEVERTNYNSDLYLSIMSGVSNKFKYHFVDESSNDVLTEAIFTRQQKVYEYLGVNIIATEYPDFSTYTTPFKTAVKNKDGSVDVMLTHVYYGVAGLVSGSFIADLGELAGIDLDADYWNREFMEDLSLSDRCYLGFSDYNILNTHVVVFNKTMMDKYADALDKSVYDMVRNYEWTVDQMIALSQLVYIDAASDGKTPDDTYGITGRQWSEFPGFLHACGVKIIEQDEKGEYKLAFMNEMNAHKTTALVEKLHQLSESEYAYFDYKTNDTPTVPFTTGRTLLHLSAVTYLEDFLSYDVPFGVLPYPVWDSAQKDVGYRHLQWSGFITVPTYLNNEQMVGETLEMLSFYSADVKTAYYEKMLGKQISDAPDDSEMFAIVWDTVCSEFAQPYCESLGGNGMLYFMADLTRAQATQNVASYYASYERSYNNAISKFTRMIEGKLKEG